MSRRAKKKAGSGKDRPEGATLSARSAVERPNGAISRPPVGWPDRWTVPGICILLAAMVWVVFGQTMGFGFVDFDDNSYIYDNPVVQKGLTFLGIAWAFTHVWASN